MSKRRSDSEKIAIVKEVETRLINGDSKDQILKDIGVAPSNYYAYKKQFSGIKNRTKKEPQLTTITIPNTDDYMTIIMGKSSDVRAALDLMRAVKHG